ncbi:MAG: hypothetical protein GF388_06685, partial [Candidatus Aegiribacteria sp.]|nr:hypothetical protein [Candidatus Aegiribacteria sp.]MBD3294836.1 hypothetical protein [Candidatus Fermentibacteria bacterium]
MKHSFFALLPILLVPVYGGAVIDHECANLDMVPAVWIESVQNDIQSHYAHTSHGSQLTYGLQFLEADSAFFDYEIGYSWLPSVSGAWCIFDGQESQTYITPDLYWESSSGMDMTRAVLDNNPEIETSMWCWCCQLDYYNQSQVQAYLDSMTVLENEYPGVTFVYFTGNAQNTGSDGYNRWQRNQQIRDYCTTNDKFLFDFADLDCWWFNPATSSWEQHTYSYSGENVPAEHPQFYGDEYGHTTAESCRQKGEALWHLMAVIAGWAGTGIGQHESASGSSISLSAVNPSFSGCQLICTLGEPAWVDMRVYSCHGRLMENIY